MGSGIKSYEAFGIRQPDGGRIVYHRYSNFKWMRERLCEKFPGCLIPPIPEKVNKALSYLTSDYEFFIEQRREGLENFLNDCKQHQQLGNSEEFLSFVNKSLQDFEVQKQFHIQETTKNAKSQSWLSSISNISSSVVSYTSGLTNNLTGNGQNYNYAKTEMDKKFDTLNSYFDTLENQISAMHQQAKALVAKRQEESQVLFEMGIQMSTLEKLESSNIQMKQPSQPQMNVRLSQPESNVNQTEFNVSHQLQFQAKKCEKQCDQNRQLSLMLKKKFEIPLEDIKRYVQSMREALTRRQTLLDNVIKCEFLLLQKKQKLTSKRGNTNEIGQLEEKRQLEIQALNSVSRQLLNEVESFRIKRASDLTALLNDFMLLQQQSAEFSVKLWMSKSLQEVQDYG